MNLYLNKVNIEKCLVYAIGLFSVMPILSIPVGGTYISLFAVFLVVYSVFLFISFFSNRQFNTQRQIILNVGGIKKTYLLFLLCPILSYLVGLFYMPERWHGSMTSNIIKAGIYLILTLMLYVENDKQYSVMFAKGFIVGITLNAIWSVLEGIAYYFFKFSLNDTLFGSSLELNREILIWNRYGGVRVCGLNYDPAHLGGILPILLFYALVRRNYYLVILSFLSLVFSQSTTALFGCIVVLFVYLFTSIRNRRKKGGKRHSIKSIAILISVFVLLSTVIIGTSSNAIFKKFTNSVSENVRGYLQRINGVYLHSTTTDVRNTYYIYAISRLFDRGPIVALTGSGLGTSMYPYRIFNGLFSSGAENKVTEIETNYIAYLFDLGIIGFALYICLLVKGVKQYYQYAKKRKTKEANIYLGTFISVICCSFTYHYIFTAYQMLTYSFSTLYICSGLKENAHEEAVKYGSLYNNTQKI